MSTLFWLWLVSFALTLALFVRGFVRAKMVPVSYEWSWSPFTFVSASLFPKGRALWARMRLEAQKSLHRLFHAFFHQMKRFHDRVFGKTVPLSQGAPSFFLKTIAEHKDVHNEANHDERKNGLS
jgi:hypothetical protein